VLLFSNILGKPFFKSPLTVFVEFEMCFYTLAVTVVIFCMIRLLRWSYRRVGDVWWGNKWMHALTSCMS